MNTNAAYRSRLPARIAGLRAAAATLDAFAAEDSAAAFGAWRARYLADELAEQMATVGGWPACLACGLPIPPDYTEVHPGPYHDSCCPDCYPTDTDQGEPL